MNIKFTNTFTRTKEVFQPLKDNTVSLYVCGVTPYDSAHVGHGRSYVNFDTLVRFLKFMGYNVTYVRNFTDIDDKLLNRAQKELGDMMRYHEIAQKYIDGFNQEVRALNCIDPDKAPLVTEHIEYIITFIASLITKGAAYAVDGDVYFDTTSFAKYGMLSGKKIDQLLSGIRVEINDKKQHPTDFVLWKGNDQNQFWPSPWGYGRPGWHIECSALAQEYLGNCIDIHGGGTDLIFPHHENELAQSESFSGQQFVRYWLHNELVMLGKEKMSKSLGNILALSEIFKDFDPMVLRYYILQHQYRTPFEFSIDSLKSAQVAYKKLIAVFDEFKPSQKFELADFENNELSLKILNAFSDDLNTPQALGIIFEDLEAIKKSKELKELVYVLLKDLFGLTLQPLKEKTVEITPQIEELLKQREAARVQKNWALADQLRAQLSELGYEVKDKKAS